MKSKPLASSGVKGRARARARTDEDRMDLSIEDPARAREKALDPEKERLISRIRLRPLQRTHLLVHRPEVGRIRGLQRTHGTTHGQARIRVPKDRITMLTEDLLQKQDSRLSRQH